MTKSKKNVKDTKKEVKDTVKEVVKDTVEEVKDTVEEVKDTVEEVVEAPREQLKMAKEVPKLQHFNGQQVIDTNSRIVNGKTYKEVRTITGEVFLLTDEEFALGIK